MSSVGSGGSAGGSASGSASPDGPGAGGEETVSIEPSGHDRLDEQDPLAPVVEHGERADQAHDRVGHPVVVGRGVGQVLDLSNDVVAEEPGETTEQRGQILDLRG